MLRSPAGQMGEKSLFRHWLAIPVALADAIAELLELLALIASLNAFGDHFFPQAVGQMPDGLGDGVVVAVVVEAAHEALIQLEGVEG